MFTAQQYRSKAFEYETLLKTARSPSEFAEYRDLQRSYTSLADNLDWLAVNGSKTVAGSANGAPSVERRKREAEHAREEDILRSLGAAVILTWDADRAAAGAVRGRERDSGPQTAPLKDALAQFLHDHKDDAQRKPLHQDGR